jgi:hypothetical protein
VPGRFRHKLSPAKQIFLQTVPFRYNTRSFATEVTENTELKILKAIDRKGKKYRDVFALIARFLPKKLLSVLSVPSVANIQVL